MNHPRSASLASLLLLAACKRSPDEPTGASPREVAPRGAHAPSMEAAARLLAGTSDAATGAPYALSVPAPAGTVFVRFARGGRSNAALIDDRRAWLGRDGAERALTLWREGGEIPDASRLARTVVAMAYPEYAAMLDRESLDLGDGGVVRGPAPALNPHPGGGRVLTFSFAIPSGQPGAGLHVARWRWTDSNLLIEETPHPERR